MPPAQGTYVALLRGVNVGGKNKLPMKDLVAMFSSAGCADPRNYIQSGNVVFRASPRLASTVGEVIGARIEERFGFRPPLVVRSATALREVAGANPFLARGADPDSLHAAFLSVAPDAARVAALDPARSPPDEFVVRGDTVYLMLPNGVGRTKLSNSWLDTRLACVSTVRNWRTVLELLAMCG